MAKVATVRLLWTKSPSADIVKQEVATRINGNETTVQLDPAAESFTIEVQALGTVSFSIKSFDNESNVATSETYTFTLGDLETPLPATNLGHEVVAVHDAP